MKYLVYSTHTQYFVDTVEANSADEAKSIISNADLDSLAFDSADFVITDVEESN
jgi:hypothetical protein